MAMGTEQAAVILTPRFSNDRKENLSLVLRQVQESRLADKVAQFVDLATSTVGITTAVAMGTNSISYAGEQIGAVVQWTP